MKYSKAEITDILRSSQRDNDFVQELQEYASAIFKLMFKEKFNYLRNYIPIFASSWYHLITSVSDLQTLGEEYVGSIRIRDNDIPSKQAQIIWLIFYVGGDKLVEIFLNKIRKTLLCSSDVDEKAKYDIIHLIDFIKKNRHIFIRLHQSLFYIYGTYHNISNRCTSMKYVLLRNWMQDDSATATFNIMGKVSLVYLLFLLINKWKSSSIPVMEYEQEQNVSSEICVLCMEKCKNVSTTPCGHLFCWRCIYDSLRYNSYCPMCREPVNPSRVVLLQNFF